VQLANLTVHESVMQRNNVVNISDGDGGVGESVRSIPAFPGAFIAVHDLYAFIKSHNLVRIGNPFFVNA